MEPIVYNKWKEIIRRTPIRIEETVDTEFVEELRNTVEEQIKLELLREQLLDAGFICESEGGESIPSDTPVYADKEEKKWAQLQHDFEIDERIRRGMDDDYIIISDDEDDDDVIFLY